MSKAVSERGGGEERAGEGGRERAQSGREAGVWWGDVSLGALTHTCHTCETSHECTDACCHTGASCMLRVGV